MVNLKNNSDEIMRCEIKQCWGRNVSVIDWSLMQLRWHAF